MAQGSTFPADDVPDRRPRILEALASHDPVPVPVTTLYLSIEDKRALADVFDDLRRSGEIEPVRLEPGATHFQDAFALTGLEPAAAGTPLSTYRLTDAGRDAARHLNSG